MGFIDFLLGTNVENVAVKAASPANIHVPYYQDAWSPLNLMRVGRSDAMQVPAVARARNIIAGTIGELGLHSYNEITGAKVEGRTILRQPDPALPRIVSMIWTCEDILFRGHAFWLLIAVDP